MTPIQQSGILKGSQKIKLVSHYSKSVRCKNSKCLNFVLVQVTPVVQKGTISPLCCTRSKNDSYSTKWHTKGFYNIKLVSDYSKSASCTDSKCLDFVLVQVTPIVQKKHNFSFRSKITPIQQNGIPRAFKISN